METSAKTPNGGLIKGVGALLLGINFFLLNICDRALLPCGSESHPHNSV